MLSIGIIALTLAIIVVFTVISFKKNPVFYLSLAFVIVYLIELYSYYQGSILQFYEVFACKSNIFDLGIFTAIYVHSLNPGHIFFNILIFFLVGMPFAQKVGNFKFTSIFLVSGLLANIGYSLFLRMSGINSFLIGASGAIFGIMGAFLILYPNEEITMFLGPILMPRVKVKYAVLAFMAVEFLATLFWVNDNVAHGAHVIGAVSGALFAYALRNYGVERIKIKSLNYEVIDELADTPELRSIAEKIKGERDEIIRSSWLLEFFRKKNGDAEFEGKYIKSGGKKYRIYR